MDEARKMLDELMGANRNGDVDEDKRRKITDSDICRNFLCGLCPPELFTNTKSALPTCFKVHDDLLQKEFVFFFFFFFFFFFVGGGFGGEQGS